MGMRCHGLIAVLVLAALQGCGKDNEVGPKPAEIYGYWKATQAEYVSHAAPSVRVDLCDSTNCWTRMQIESDHTLKVMVRHAPAAPDTTAGTWQLDGDLFKMYPGGFSWYWTWDIQLSGNTLKLTGADVRWDFDEDGLLEDNEEADWNLVLVR